MFEYRKCVPGAAPTTRSRSATAWYSDDTMSSRSRGRPAEWVIRSCGVIGSKDDSIENHGRYAVTGAFGSKRPSSRSCSRAIEVNDLVIEPIARRWAGGNGV